MPYIFDLDVDIVEEKNDIFMHFYMGISLPSIVILCFLLGNEKKVKLVNKEFIKIGFLNKDIELYNNVLP